MSNYKGEDRLEKHYTPDFLIKDMFEMLETYYKGNISEFLENSAGSGNLIDKLKHRYPNIPILAYDILNETHRPDIIEADYLKQKIEYKEGRVTFMNPPFQKGLKFVYKALKESDYVVTVLSHNSIINVNYDLYEVDRIYFYKNVDFGSCKATCCIMGLRNKVVNE